MACGTPPLGSREDPGPPRRAGRIVGFAPSRWRRGGGPEDMADVAYVLVVAGGFALLALMLRGLERL